MKILVFGVTGAIGKPAVQSLFRWLDSKSEIVLAGRDKNKITEIVKSFGTKNISAKVSIVTTTLPIKDLASFFTPIKNLDAVLNCAGPAYKYSFELAAYCAKQQIPYVDIGGDSRLILELNKIPTSVPILLGAGVQPGLVGFIVRQYGSSGAKIILQCGGAQFLSKAGVAEYIRSIEIGEGWPNKYFQAGKICEIDKINNTINAFPLPPTTTASYKLYLDPECALAASDVGLDELYSYNIIEGNRTAITLSGLLADEFSLDALMSANISDMQEMALANQDPYFTIQASIYHKDFTEQIKVLVSDSYVLSGKLAARAVLDIGVSVPGVAWASTSKAAQSWNKYITRTKITSPTAVVVGGTFGRYYAQALINPAAPAKLVGIMGNSGGLSKDLAKFHKVAYTTSVVRDVDIAVVVVKAGVIGGQGDEVAAEFLRAGVSVLQEHPIDSHTIGKLYALSCSKQIAYLPTGFYEYLPTTKKWIAVLRKLQAAKKIKYIMLRTSIQVFERALLILSLALERVPLTLPQVQSSSDPTRVLLTSIWGDIPVDIILSHRMDPDFPDTNCQPIMSVLVTTDDGELEWPHVYSPLLWMPRVDRISNAPISDIINSNELISDWLNTSPKVDGKKLEKELWPQAITNAISTLLVSKINKNVMINQRYINIIDWWQKVIALLPPLVEIHTPIPKVNTLEILKF